MSTVEAVLRTFARVLGDHHVVCTVSGRDALAIIARDEPFDVIFSDLMMPTMTGMDFYEALLGSNPDLARRVVFISGGVTSPRVEDFLRSVPNLRLEKPFTVAGLLETVQKLLKVSADWRQWLGWMCSGGTQSVSQTPLVDT
jgi:CheY-like chemotaxis protein